MSWLEDVESPRTRRDSYGPLAVELLRAGLPDLALGVAGRALELDHHLDDAGDLVQDLISYGCALVSLDRPREAAAAFGEARDVALEIGSHAAAARASTNLAAVLADEGRLQEAAALLRRSLRLLKRAPFPDAEIKTRLMLLQVWEAMGEPSAQREKLARETVERWGAELSDGDRAWVAEHHPEALGSAH